MLLARRCARDAVAGCVLAGALLFGGAPLAQAAPAPVPGSTCTVQAPCPGQSPAGSSRGAQGLAVRLPVRLGLLPLRLGRLALHR